MILLRVIFSWIVATLLKYVMTNFFARCILYYFKLPVVWPQFLSRANLKLSLIEAVTQVSDFGLCRLSDSLLYTGKRGRLPLRWMAPESLKSYEYSHKSDVCVYYTFVVGKILSFHCMHNKYYIKHQLCFVKVRH